MKIHFHKYHGTGNDFIILDNREGLYRGLTEKQIRSMCHRNFGIGADGLMLLNPHSRYDFEMKYYNADGRPGSMCGNGARCIVQFAWDSGLQKTTYRFLAADGEHEANMESNGLISLRMQDVEDIEETNGRFILNTGSPHYVMPVDDVMHVDVCKKGREIRYSPPFKKEGINVNFVQQDEERDKITVRTYERGVEDETLSCGTGVTAAALALYHNDIGFNRVDVETKGGHLSVEFDRRDGVYRNIWLIGPTEKVFEGDIEIK